MRWVLTAGCEQDLGISAFGWTAFRDDGSRSSLVTLSSVRANGGRKSVVGLNTELLPPKRVGMPHRFGGVPAADAPTAVRNASMWHRSTVLSDAPNAPRHGRTLRLDERRWQRRAVDRRERPIPPGLALCTARANSFFPVPVSPASTTEASVARLRHHEPGRRGVPRLSPMMSSKLFASLPPLSRRTGLRFRELESREIQLGPEEVRYFGPGQGVRSSR